jgi:hypothetical protein
MLTKMAKEAQTNTKYPHDIKNNIELLNLAANTRILFCLNLVISINFVPFIE